MKPMHHVLLSSLLATFSVAIPLATTSAASKLSPGLNGETIKLPDPAPVGKTSIEQALRERRSIRFYKNLPLTMAELSQLLWSVQGMTTPGRRTVPSAGALYPLEIYAVVGKVTDMPSGVYRYIPQGHELQRVMDGDRRAALVDAALGQVSVRNAPVVLVISAVYDRTTAKYGKRGIRYVHMEAGHAAQNVYLQAVSLGLGTFVIGAFDDDRVKKTIGMTEQEQPLSLMPVGKK